ncbi:MAG TPA: hypothetical protein DEP45_01650 [Armatimonadetes bacterium]|nr:hypothetical protein [Armatimonadota bacterium]
MSHEEEARWLRETIDRLPMANCCGCDGCAARCMGGLAITRSEFEAICEYFGGPMFMPAARAYQCMGAPCEFKERSSPRCIIYPVRPLICRLFGIVEWLPCPMGTVPTLVPDGPRVMQRYRQFERRTFREWARNSVAGDRGETA